MCRISLIFILIFVYLPGKGQEPWIRGIDSVVVTSPRIPQVMGETGRDITILDRKELNSIPAESVDELFRYVTGVETQQRGSYGVQSDLSIRGSTFSQVLVLLDGMRVNDPLTGHFNANIPVTLSEIERIEIIEGPSAAQYGPDAVGGIINIITRSFSERSDHDRFRSSGLMGAGQYSLFKLEAGAGWNPGKIGIGAGLKFSQSDGFPFDKGIPGRFNLKTGTLSLRIPVNEKILVSYRIGADTRDYSAWHYYTHSASDSATEETGSLWNQFRISRTVGRSVLSLDASSRRGTDNYLFNSNSQPNKHTTWQENIHLAYRLNFTQELAIAAGFQGWEQQIESNDRGNHRSAEEGVYFLALVRPFKNTVINGGIRAENNSVYGFGLLPQFSLVWHRGRIALRAATGKSFRTPDFTERFIGTALDTLLPGRNLGNPSLAAEESWSHEAGLDFKVNSWLKTRLTLFSRNGKSLIDYVETPAEQIPLNQHLTPGGLYYYAENISHLVTNGAELNLQASYKPSISTQIGFNAGYTLLHNISDIPLVSRYLSNHSKQVFTTMLYAEYSRFGAGITGLWKERELTKSMSDLGMKASYSLLNMQFSVRWWDGKLKTELQVSNLFDKFNMDIPGLPGTGRWWSVGLRWNFEK